MSTKKINIAFFDSEFTATTAENRGIQELIQCAFIVHQIEMSSDSMLLSMTSTPLFEYSTYVKPTYNKTLSDYIKRLTGIKQKDVEEGKIFRDAINDLYKLTKDYDIHRIIVWGPDRGMLKHNFDVMDYSRSKARNLLNLFTDVSYDVSDLFGYDQPLSQHKVCQMMGIQEVGELHDAYADAQNLAQIIRGFCGKDPRKL